MNACSFLSFLLGLVYKDKHAYYFKYYTFTPTLSLSFFHLFRKYYWATCSMEKCFHLSDNVYNSACTLCATEFDSSSITSTSLKITQCKSGKRKVSLHKKKKAN